MTWSPAFCAFPRSTSSSSSSSSSYSTSYSSFSSISLVSIVFLLLLSVPVNGFVYILNPTDNGAVGSAIASSYIVFGDEARLSAMIPASSIVLANPLASKHFCFVFVFVFVFYHL